LPRLLAFSPDGKTLAALRNSVRGGELQLFDTDTGTLIRTAPIDSYCDTLQFSSHGESVILTVPSGKRSGLIVVPLAGDGTPRTVEMPAVKPTAPKSVFRPFIHHIAVSPDARIAALGTADGSVIICDAASGTMLRELPEPPFSALYSSTGSDGRSKAVSALTFCDNNILAVSGGRNVRFFDASTGALKGTLRFLVTSSEDPLITMSQNQLRFLTTENGDSVSDWFWESPDGKWNASPSVRPLVKKRGVEGQLLSATP
jgi:WD40 repeat protein